MPVASVAPANVPVNVVVLMVEVVSAYPVVLVPHAAHELTTVIYHLGSNFSFDLWDNRLRGFEALS